VYLCDYLSGIDERRSFASNIGTSEEGKGGKEYGKLTDHKERYGKQNKEDVSSPSGIERARGRIPCKIVRNGLGIRDLGFFDFLGF
jgi:hypothetical protein